jgi:hypothetical protein
MFASIFVQQFLTGFGQQRFQHHVFAVTRGEMLTVQVLRNHPISALPCFLSIRPVLSRCLPSKPFFAMLLLQRVADA